MPAKQAMRYDAAEFLESDANIVAYLNAALEDGDPSLVSAALGDIARARGISQLAKETGNYPRRALQGPLAYGKPSFATIQRS